MRMGTPTRGQDEGSGNCKMKGMWKLHDLIESGRPVAGIGSISKLTQTAWLSLWPSLGTGLGQGEGQVKRLSWAEVPGS